MATIVEHKETQMRFVLLGTGFGMYRAKAPNMLFGNLLPETEKGFEQVICACKPNGEILWLRAKDVKVISIDGKSPDQVFHF